MKRFVAKMRGYAYAREQRKPVYGQTDYRVLVVGSGTYILDHYRRALDMERFSGWVWIATLDTVAARSATTPA